MSKNSINSTLFLFSHFSVSKIFPSVSGFFTSSRETKNGPNFGILSETTNIKMTYSYISIKRTVLSNVLFNLFPKISIKCIVHFEKYVCDTQNVLFLTYCPKFKFCFFQMNTYIHHQNSWLSWFTPIFCIN